MADSNFSGPVRSAAGFVGQAAAQGTDTHLVYGTRRTPGFQTVTVNVVDGAAAGTFTLPAGVKIRDIVCETPTAIPGTPTNTNLRIGSSANGQQYVADVDVKAQGFLPLTLLYPTRNPATTVHFTVASTGGTASAQDGTILLHVEMFT